MVAKFIFHLCSFLAISKVFYRLAFVQMKNKHDAEDVFQDVFLRYIAKPRIFESEEHRKAWLIRVTILL